MSVVFYAKPLTIAPIKGEPEPRPEFCGTFVAYCDNCGERFEDKKTADAHGACP